MYERSAAKAIISIPLACFVVDHGPDQLRAPLHLWVLVAFAEVQVPLFENEILPDFRLVGRMLLNDCAEQQHSSYFLLDMFSIELVLSPIHGLSQCGAFD